mmetsp:Transcript_49451/g.127452  ORF Transcript_49451/g.127452 Transcript_49451/m.127452 type:complete len:204 (+) Transcript_49451:1224-1835(+)
MLGHVEGLPDRQISLGAVSMHLEIVCRPVCVADGFDPAISSVELGIPAVAGIMGHFGGEMLSETNLVFMNAAHTQEKVCPGYIVAECLVLDHARFHCLSDGHCDHLAFVVLSQLGVCREKGDLHILYVLKFIVLSTRLGIEKVLNFSHLELTHSEETGTGGDLISICVADLCRSERKLASTELSQPLEVQEDTLRSLWPEEGS